MVNDQAPKSTQLFLDTLVRYGLPSHMLAGLAIRTEVSRHLRAVTTIDRVKVGGGPKAQAECDQRFAEAFRKLPGFGGSYQLTMGRTFSVEWDGVRAPV